MKEFNIDPYKALTLVVESTIKFDSNTFLESVCKELKNLFHADLVFITEAMDCNPTTKVKILYATSKDLPDSFELEGSPCKLVFDDQIIRISEGVHLDFEKSKETNFESFYGIPLHNRNSVCIGHIAIFSSQKRIIPEEIEDIALIFARRIETEYERDMLEKENDKYQEKLQSMIITDSLTQTYNRRHFDDIAKDVLAQVKRDLTTATLCFFDIDNFKKINDEFGHEVGDNVLKYLSRVLKDNCREGIDYIFRIGGEEFAIISIDSTIDSSFTFAKRIKRFLETDEKNKKHKVSFSIGIDEFKKSDLNYDDVYKRADNKMYEAKREGKNSIVK